MHRPGGVGLGWVRTAAGPDMAVGIRTSIAHHIPGARDDYDASTSLRTVAALEADGLLDFVSLMSGSYRAVTHTIPTMAQLRMAMADPAQAFVDSLDIRVTVANRMRTAQEAEP